MEHKQVIDKLNSFENAYPVKEWIIDDISVWPLIRCNLFKEWRDLEQSKQVQAKKAKPKSSGTSGGLISSLKLTAKFLMSLRHVLSFRLKKSTKIPILFTGSIAHRVELDGAHVNRYFQPIIDFLKAKYQRDSIIVEYFKPNYSKTYKSSDQVIFLAQFIPFFQVINAFKFTNMQFKLKDYDLFLNAVQEQLPFVNIQSFSVPSLQNDVKEIKVIASAYDLFLEKYKPDYAFGLCYYNVPVFALNYAASKRGIISADMQHGGQGKLHVAYGNYGAVPDQGYNLLPNIFWCWDEASYNVVNSWVSKQSFHKVILGGNPWLDYFFETNVVSYSFPNKKIILYTMQLDVPEQYIVDAVKLTPPDFQWWFRFHPRTTAENKKAVVDLFTHAGLIDAVEMDKATTYPLPIILKNTSVHISKFSGSIIEATQLGVKTILIGATGVETFQDYIKSNEAVPFLEGSASDFARLILKISSLEDLGSSNRDLKKYQKVIQNLIEN
jgi:hypothetical protein